MAAQGGLQRSHAYSNNPPPPDGGTALTWRGPHSRTPFSQTQIGGVPSGSGTISLPEPGFNPRLGN